MRQKSHFDCVSRWDEAVLAAKVFAVNPIALGGILVKARYSPVRDLWFKQVRALFPDETPFRKLPLHMPQERLSGEIDLTASLVAGRPVFHQGVLDGVKGGVLVMYSVERVETGVAAQASAAMDEFSVIAFDESDGDEDAAPPCLQDRLGFHVELDGISWNQISQFDLNHGDITAVRHRLADVTASDDQITALCEAAFALGIVSLRPSLFAVRCACVLAALDSRQTVSKDDISLAAKLVLAPRTRIVPEMQRGQGTDNTNERGAPNVEDQNQTKGEDQVPNTEDLRDMILASVEAALPGDTLKLIKPDKKRGLSLTATGANGNLASKRGRPAGTSKGMPSGGARLALIETLRAAAPWQTIRHSFSKPLGHDLPNAEADASGEHKAVCIAIHCEDLRVQKCKAAAQTATIFVVDASGSTALQRLGEAKGAVELLLSECYIRRDQVALIGFRGDQAQLLLPPTRSLTRAKRSLASLVGGGGTPLASGLDAGLKLALNIRRRGLSPLIVLLTDGRANVSLDGKGGRINAQDQAMATAKHVRRFSIPSLLIDTSQRPQAAAEHLAQEMAAHYVALPHADATSLMQAVRKAQIE